MSECEWGVGKVVQLRVRVRVWLIFMGGNFNEKKSRLSSDEFVGALLDGWLVVFA